MRWADWGTAHWNRTPGGSGDGGKRMSKRIQLEFHALGLARIQRTWYKSIMRRWMRDRVRRRNQKNKNPQQSEVQPQGPAPLQPTFLDRESSWAERSEGRGEAAAEGPPQPVYEAQPEKDPFDSESASGNQSSGRRDRSRRRGRGGRGRNRTDQQQKAAQSAGAPGLPIVPGQATGEAAEIDEPEAAAETPEQEAF